MLDSSDESEDIGFFAEGVDSDEHENEFDDSSDATGEHEHLLDLEAQDSDDESADSAEENSGNGDSDHDLYLFPQFKRLPAELRHRIWEFFCPDLTVKSRVYWFQVMLHRRRWSSGKQELVPLVYPGPLLEQQTRAARLMMAVHHESRALGLKAFPDTLALADKGRVRFHGQRDLVFIDSTENVFLELDALPSIPKFSKHIRNLVLDPGVLHDLEIRSASLFGGFENLQAVYYLLSSPGELRPRNLRWCASDQAKHYHFTSWEEQPGLGENAQHMYCWPDLNKHAAFARAEIPLENLAEDLMPQGLYIKNATFQGKKIWPVAQFLWGADVDRYQMLTAWDGEAELDWESGSEMDGAGEPDEYESDGIDDSDISDEVGSDTDDLMVVNDEFDSDYNEEGSTHSAPSISGLLNLGDNDLEEGGARFSSPEQSSATLRDDSDQSEQDYGAPAPRTSGHKRRRVADSDSEDDDSEDDLPRKRVRTKSHDSPAEISSDDDSEEDDFPRKRAHTNTRDNPVEISSDDESEDDVPRKRSRIRHSPLEISSSDNEAEERRKMQVNFRRRTVVTDDEDEDDDGDGNDRRGWEGEDDGTHHRDEEAVTDWSGVSSSEEEDGESEEGGSAVPKSMSLAEKLQLHREKVPLPPSNDEDSEIEEMEGDDYDARNYADFQDDDEAMIPTSEESDSGEDYEHGAILGGVSDGEEDGY